MSRPPITALCTTYFPPGAEGALRERVAEDVVATWERHLSYDGEIRLHVADDGSDEEHFEKFWAFTERWRDSSSSQQRRGVGASLNHALRAAFAVSPLALYLIDDWKALADFDLTPWADLLINDDVPPARTGMVRFSPPHPGLTGVVTAFPSGWGLRLDRHNFAFATRPALYHQRMIDRYGWFDEGVNAFVVEDRYNNQFCEGMDGDIGIVLALPLIFDHVESIELGDITPV